MKIPSNHLRRIEELEARSAGPAPRPEDRLSFGELADLPSLGPEAREQLLQVAQRRTPRQVDALRRPELERVEATIPPGEPVTLEGLAQLMLGAATRRERRLRAVAFLAVRDLDLVVVQQLRRLADANH